MSIQTIKLIRFIGVGAVIGLFLLGAFIAVLLASKGTSLHGPVTGVFDCVNNPLKLISLSNDLAERQDPLLSMAFIACYWFFLGSLAGAIAFAANLLRGSSTNENAAELGNGGSSNRKCSQAGSSPRSRGDS